MKEFTVEVFERDGLNPYAQIQDQYGHVYGTYYYNGNTPEEAREKALADLPEVEWSEGQPVGVRTSNALVEARTVLSRAETALHWMDRWIDDRAGSGLLVDPELIDIATDLYTVTTILRKWERTGRMKAYKPPKEEEK